MSGNPFLTVSQEDTAAFADHFAEGLDHHEENYLKGKHGDNPFLVEENKTQAATDEFVAEQREHLDETLTGGVATESDEAVNPFIGGVAEAVAEVETQEAEESTSNPFLDASEEVQPEEAPAEEPGVIPGVESLEEIITELQDAMDATATNARNTEFRVDVELDESSRELLEQDINAVIAQAPETYESLEGICILAEKSVPKILSILTAKRKELRSE